MFTITAQKKIAQKTLIEFINYMLPKWKDRSAIEQDVELREVTEDYIFASGQHTGYLWDNFGHAFRAKPEEESKEIIMCQGEDNMPVLTYGCHFMRFGYFDIQTPDAEQ